MIPLSGLRIYFVAGTLGQGGAEQQLFYQLQTLKQAGAEPWVICLSGDGYWQAPIERLGVRVVALAGGRSRMGRLVRMLPLIRQGRPAIIQSAHFFTNLYALLSARYSKAHDIGAIRNDGIHDVAAAGFPGGTLSLRLPAWLASNSQNAIQNAVRLGRSPTRLVLLPNLVDTGRFCPGEHRSRREIHILMVGRLVRQKRFDTFIRLLSRLHQGEGLKPIGHIVGDGPNLETLRTLAARLGLQNGQVRFHGSISDAERLYRLADICIHLSDWEGLPNSVLEAMSSGLPVVASRVGGIEEIVEDGVSGFLIDAHEGPGLETAVTRLMNDPVLRASMGRKGREFVERRHSLIRMRSNLGSLYEAVLSA